MAFSRFIVLILTGSAFAACASPPAAVVVDTDASNADVPPKAGFGRACTLASGCAAGLKCMQSEYAPFGWCTRDCATTEKAADYCVGPELGGNKAFCVQMPTKETGAKQDWLGQKAPFCAPICDNTGDCHALDAQWEKCEKPTYKQAVLPGYNALPTKVCDAPSSYGQIIVDPITCQWKDKVKDMAPTTQPAVGICDNYCTFLTTCQFFDPKQIQPNCCTWHCFQSLTPGGLIDNAKVSAIKCFNNAYNNSVNSGVDPCGSQTLHVSQCDAKYGKPCKSAGDCDDGEKCTSDACLNFLCVNNTIPTCN